MLAAGGEGEKEGVRRRTQRAKGRDIEVGNGRERDK